MSKERELLARVLTSELWSVQEELQAEIKELLAQPEQEPVAWCQMVEGKVQDLLTNFEMKDWIYDKSWMPLYTAPQKREPLSNEEIQILYGRHAFAMELDEYMWGFRDAEKAHGIGVGE